MSRCGAFLLVVVLLSLGPQVRAQTPEVELPNLGVLVAQTFLRALTDKDLKTAAPLCAEQVNFDGQVVKGAQAVRKKLHWLMSRLRGSRRLKRVVVMTLGRAQQIFGAPPARLRLPRRSDLLAGFGRFDRGGLVVILAPERDRWRVIALTD